ncbi:BCCT family transporter, partial [Virgibacillus salexigens]|uniref:BCCT family transporter n=1 Tax=Virgibacillus salexigens TaxID=61016 RepID=UPI003081813E
GISKGIKYLSNTNIILAVLLLGLTFILGPTTFILNTFISTLGDYVESFVSLSFQTGSFDDNFNGWVQQWTVFYWA